MKDLSFQQIMMEQLDIQRQKKKKKNPHLDRIPFTENNSKWITKLKIKRVKP